MQFPLPTATLGAAMGALVLAGAFLYIRRFGDGRALGWWSAALIANAARQTLNFVAAITGSEALEPLVHLSLIAISPAAAGRRSAALAWVCLALLGDVSFLA